MIGTLRPAIAFLFLVLAAIPSAAQTPSDPGLAFFVGSWDIEAATPGEAGTEKFSYEVGPLLPPAWIQGHGRSEKPGFESRDVWGKDGFSGEYVRTIFDGSGTHAVVRSPGWDGDRLVLTGEARSASGVVRVRETIERQGADRFVATWEAYRNGAWSAYSIEQVSRRKGGR